MGFNLTRLGSLGVANIVGAVDTLTPGRVGQTLNANLRDGGVDMYGTPHNAPATYGTGGAGWGPTTAGQLNSSDVTAVSGASNTTGGSATGGSTYNPQNNAYINQVFDTRKAGLQSQYDLLAPQETASTQRVGSVYNTQLGDLNTSLAQGQRNLSFSKDQVNSSKERSLKNLRDQINAAVQSYANQLGNYGAGDSSASQLINFALAGQGSRNRGDVLQNATGQLQQIGMQEQDLQTSYDQDIRDLDDWKSTTLNDIATSYLQQRQAIQNAMTTADAERAQQLAQYDASLTQQAINYLAQLEGQYTQNAQNLASKYSSFTAPSTVGLDPALLNYNVQDIQPGALTGLELPQAVNPEAIATTLFKKRPEDELV